MGRELASCSYYQALVLPPAAQDLLRTAVERLQIEPHLEGAGVAEAVDGVARP